MVGQASSLSISDDGQDAHPTGNPRSCKKRLLRSARNDHLLPRVIEESLSWFSSC